MLTLLNIWEDEVPSHSYIATMFFQKPTIESSRNSVSSVMRPSEARFPSFAIHLHVQHEYISDAARCSFVEDVSISWLTVPLRVSPIACCTCLRKIIQLRRISMSSYSLYSISDLISCGHRWAPLTPDERIHQVIGRNT